MYTPTITWFVCYEIKPNSHKICIFNMHLQKKSLTWLICQLSELAGYESWFRVSSCSGTRRKAYIFRIIYYCQLLSDNERWYIHTYVPTYICISWLLIVHIAGICDIITTQVHMTRFLTYLHISNIE